MRLLLSIYYLKKVYKIININKYEIIFSIKIYVFVTHDLLVNRFTYIFIVSNCFHDYEYVEFDINLLSKFSGAKRILKKWSDYRITQFKMTFHLFHVKRIRYSKS